jgi:uncharacterized protein (DUF1697 family)
MADLSAMCAELGFTQVRTYIASGNVVFHSLASAAQVKRGLEGKLLAYAGKPVGVMVRSATDMRAVLADNPFHTAAPNRVVAIFLDSPPKAASLDGIKGQTDEAIALGRQEIYVHYGAGMAASRLKIPATQTGTARNMNTIAKLVGLADAVKV